MLTTKLINTQSLLVCILKIVSRLKVFLEVAPLCFYFRLMQLNQSPLRPGYNYDHLITSTRNRVEFISDFPPENSAEMISSLEVITIICCVVTSRGDVKFQ